MKFIIKQTVLISMIAMIGILLVSCGSGSSGTRPNNDVNKRNGLDLYQQQNYFAATDWLIAALAKNPDDTEVYVALLDAWHQLGEITQVD